MGLDEQQREAWQREARALYRRECVGAKRGPPLKSSYMLRLSQPSPLSWPRFKISRQALPAERRIHAVSAPPACRAEERLRFTPDEAILPYPGHAAWWVADVEGLLLVLLRRPRGSPPGHPRSIDGPEWRVRPERSRRGGRPADLDGIASWIGVRPPRRWPWRRSVSKAFATVMSTWR